MVAGQITPLVKKISDRLREPNWVKEILFHPSNRNPDPRFPEQWNARLDDFRLMDNEYPGVLILLAELDSLFPNEQWDAAIHAYVLKLKELIESKKLNSLSLFGGTAGIAFTLQQASRKGTRYQRMIANLNMHLLNSMNQNYLSPLDENFKAQKSSPFSLYDLIQGIIGIGVYSLNNLHDPSFLELTKNIAKRLINLTQPLEVEGRKVPGWYMPNHFQVSKRDQQLYPKGNFNLGVAHGIPGVLAFLSLALLKGVEIDGQREAINCITEWIKGHRQEHEGNLFWGTHISFEEEIEDPRSKRSPSTKRNAWCYGTAGVARSLFLAGKAMKCEDLKSFAYASFCSIFVQNRQEWGLPSPTFCHGIAGLFMTTWKMYQDTQTTFLKQKVDTLKEILLGYYHEDYPFGFKNLDPTRKGGFIEISQLNLIEGVSGILLTLLSLEGSNSGWHAPFLIGEL
jgi:hypothetical protein